MTILKEEINDAIAAIFNLSKWKLVIVSVLAAAGLGIQKDVAFFEHGYLLLFLTPLFCAYVDLSVYEKTAVIHLIAKYLREYYGRDADTLEIRQYERFMENCRDTKLYTGYENAAHFAASLGFSIALPALAWIHEKYRLQIVEHWYVITLPVISIGLLIFLYVRLRKQIKKISLTPIHILVNGEEFFGLSRVHRHGPFA